MAAVPDTALPPLDPDPSVAEDLIKLRDLLHAHDIEGARAYIKELTAKWPDSERVRYYAHVLAPPVARRVPGSKPARSQDREIAWLRAHGHEHPGRWLSIFEDRLIAADPNLHTVIERTREAIGDQSALLFYQGAPETS